MATTAKLRKTRSCNRQTAGCRAGAQQPAAQRTRRTRGNGFLTHAFQPVWLYEGDRRPLEREFQNSLSNLCAYYALAMPQVQGLPFPQGIYAAWQEVEQALRKNDKECYCIIVADGKRRATLATAEMLGIGMEVYYIPTRPLWHWLHQAERQGLTEILIPIFAYLTQVANVPCYAQPYSYIEQEYETLKQWIAEDRMADDPDDEEMQGWREEQERTIYDMERAAGYFQRFFDDPEWLRRLETVATEFQPRDKLEQEALALARQFAQLYREFPNTDIYTHTGGNLLFPENEDRITPGQYTHIFWSCRDVFVEQLNEMINNEFMEIAYTDEPVLIRHFDQNPPQCEDSLAFERQFFPLIEQLRDLLNKHDFEPAFTDY